MNPRGFYVLARQSLEPGSLVQKYQSLKYAVVCHIYVCRTDPVEGLESFSGRRRQSIPGGLAAASMLPTLPENDSSPSTLPFWVGLAGLKQEPIQAMLLNKY